MWVFTLLLFFIAFANPINSIESDLTVSVNPGKRECFHQYVEQGSNFDMEYQVIDGGDLDINFMVQAPSGRIMVTEIKKIEGSHTLEAIETGDYKFCLDNTFSRFSSKMVFFELMTDDKDANWPKLDDIQKDEDFSNQYEIQLDDFQDVLDMVKQRLDKTQQSQKILRTIEARDRKTAEMNFERINFWSCVHMVVMITVGLIQVFLVRSLFEDKSMSSKFKVRT